MKIVIEPFYDSYYSNPPDVEFEEGGHTITIKLHEPDREIQIERKDFERLLGFITST